MSIINKTHNKYNITKNIIKTELDKYLCKDLSNIIFHYYGNHIIMKNILAEIIWYPNGYIQIINDGYYNKNDCCYLYHYVFPKFSMLHNAIDVQQNNKACAILYNNRKVKTWGASCYGGCSYVIRKMLVNIVKICKVSCAFAAITINGRVITWGTITFNNTSLKQLHKILFDTIVVKLYSNDKIFYALTSDNRVIVWSFYVENKNYTEYSNDYEQKCYTVYPTISEFRQSEIVLDPIFS
jgi:hypothetical protein